MCCYELSQLQTRKGKGNTICIVLDGVFEVSILTFKFVLKNIKMMFKTKTICFQKLLVLYHKA